jgi:hypothetical protein
LTCDKSGNKIARIAVQARCVHSIRVSAMTRYVMLRRDISSGSKKVNFASANYAIVNISFFASLLNSGRNQSPRNRASSPCDAISALRPASCRKVCQVFLQAW